MKKFIKLCLLSLFFVSCKANIATKWVTEFNLNNPKFLKQDDFRKGLSLLAQLIFYSIKLVETSKNMDNLPAKEAGEALADVVMSIPVTLELYDKINSAYNNEIAQALADIQSKVLDSQEKPDIKIQKMKKYYIQLYNILIANKISTTIEFGFKKGKDLPKSPNQIISI